MQRFLAQPDFLELTLGIQRFERAFDPAALFEFRICNTDSTRATKLDFFAPRVVVCTNMVDSEAHLRREGVAALVKMYDFFRHRAQPPSCERLACSAVRALALSKACRELTRGRGVPAAGRGGGAADAGGVPGGGPGAGAGGGAGGVRGGPVSFRPFALGHFKREPL